MLRLGCIDTDEQLQSTISKFLPPVLEKITSPHEAVRLKVMEVLTHINKRLKARPLIQVPVEPCIQLYLQTDSSYAMVRPLPHNDLLFSCQSYSPLQNFSIIYITMGFPRMTVEQQTQFVPLLLSSMHGKPEIHQDK